MRTFRHLAALVFVGFLAATSSVFVAAKGAKNDVTLYSVSFMQGKDYGCPCSTDGTPWILKNSGERTVIVTIAQSNGGIPAKLSNAREETILAGDTKCLQCRKSSDGNLVLTGARYK